MRINVRMWPMCLRSKVFLCVLPAYVCPCLLRPYVCPCVLPVKVCPCVLLAYACPCVLLAYVCPCVLRAYDRTYCLIYFLVVLSCMRLRLMSFPIHCWTLYFISQFFSSRKSVHFLSSQSGSLSLYFLAYFQTLY
jgi:hypothetical protein